MFVALPSLPTVATEAVVLAPQVVPGQEQQEGLSDLAEFSISRVLNRQYSGQQRVGMGGAGTVFLWPWPVSVLLGW